MKAPENIYIIPHTLTNGFCRRWFEEPLKRECIEYVRTDAFIEKACEWLRQHMKTLPELSNKDFTKHTLWKRDEIIDKFRQAMEE